MSQSARLLHLSATDGELDRLVTRNAYLVLQLRRVAEAFHRVTFANGLHTGEGWSRCKHPLCAKVAEAVRMDQLVSVQTPDDWEADDERKR